jgi:hypothetical protein
MRGETFFDRHSPSGLPSEQMIAWRLRSFKRFFFRMATPRRFEGLPISVGDFLVCGQSCGYGLPR